MNLGRAEAWSAGSPNAHRQQEILLGLLSLNTMGAQVKEPTGQEFESPYLSPGSNLAHLRRSLNPSGPGFPRGRQGIHFRSSSCFFLGATISVHIGWVEGTTFLSLTVDTCLRPAQSAYSLPLDIVIGSVKGSWPHQSQ